MTNTKQITVTSEEQKLLEVIQPGINLESQDSYVQALAYVAWARLAEPGDAMAQKFISKLGVVQALQCVIENEVPNTPEFLALGSSARKALARWSPRLSRQATFQDLKAAAGEGAKLLTPGHPHWPNQIKDLQEHQPITLWCKGNTDLLSKNGVAIVGARASTRYGETVTNDFSKLAVSENHTVISGGAYGIDGVAHRAAMAAGGQTIAFLAGGIDRIYPSGHSELFAKISENGLICSELVPGSAPTRWRFLQRNRLISCSAVAVLVTEAGIRSGSINTAGHAAELARPLGAVPGPITSVSSLGSHKLLREFNAQIVADETDFKELLGISPTAIDDRGFSERELSSYSRVIDSIPLRGSKPAEEVAKDAGLDFSSAIKILYELEMLGRVIPIPKNGDSRREWKLAG